MPSPSDEYRSRLAARQQRHQALSLTEARISYVRLAVFALGALTAWLAFGRGVVHPALVALPVLIFLGLVWWHARVISEREQTSRAITFYQRGLARLEDRWAGGGESGDRFQAAAHPYAADLDLFGRGSLFELLSIARTRAGEETLASWLLTPAPPDEVTARQQAVRELTPRLELREALALAGSDVRATVMTEALTAWASAPLRFQAAWLQPVAALISAVSIGSIATWLLGGPAWPAGVALLLVIGFSGLVGKGVTTVLHGAGQPVRDLDVLTHALTHLEQASFTSTRLTRSTASITEGEGASRAIRRLQRLSEQHDWQHNVIFGFIAAFVLWGPHLAFAVERWRRRHGVQVVAWLTAVGDVEALSSLATYAYEHPDDPFPTLADGPATFEANGLGHPLLPAAQMVRNDVRLGHPAQLLVVSGSNMSGKSTLLRSVGVNAVLAFAGAPVRATRLTLTPLAIGATLRVQDSIQDGRSRFYAEITRLRELADLAAGPAPLLFLLDELLHGTNSHDRLAGGTGVLKDLLDRGAIGLVTTHDMALAGIVDQITPRAANVHFEDQFEDGQIHFDYRMRPGPVTRSNALALMQAIGLRVGPTAT
ncbi:MAG: DNA mismatch repair protein MutS [Vicinamibacterales bacterium]